MYIHRVVIDANCINSKGRMGAMNDLEDYHDAGLIEILKTSTLGAELDPDSSQKEKAKKYFVIGSSGIVNMGDDRDADAYCGAVSGEPQFYEYFLEIFKNKLTKESRRRAFRDCLHIDQAILNRTNYFVTKEKLLIQAGQEIQAIKNKIKILSPDDCLSELKSYFLMRHGSYDLVNLKQMLNSHGPVFFGSNSGFGLTVIDPVSDENLLSVQIREGKLIIEARIRNKNGALILEVSEGDKSQFHTGGARIKGMGRGPLVLGDMSLTQVCITNDETVYLSAYALSSSRVLFDCVNLWSFDGERYFSVDKEVMTLKGLILKGPQNAL